MKSLSLVIVDIPTAYLCYFVDNGQSQSPSVRVAGLFIKTVKQFFFVQGFLIARVSDGKSVFHYGNNDLPLLDVVQEGIFKQVLQQYFGKHGVSLNDQFVLFFYDDFNMLCNFLFFIIG